MKVKNLGIFSALFASVCCLGPLILVLAGLGGLGLGALIGKYHWWFLGGGVLLIILAWRYYFKEKKSCALKACQMENRKQTLIILIVATIFVAFFAGLNFYTYLDLGKSTEIIQPPLTANIRTAIIPVEGMTCLTCEITVRSALKKVDGVISASASAKEKSAKVTYDPNKTNVHKLVKTINKTGYKASPVRNAKPKRNEEDF